MADPEFELVDVGNGLKSLRSLEFGQTFHPVTGPMGEARALHVAQQRLVVRVAAGDTPFVIWDVGFGAAANAIAALEALFHCGKTVHLHSFDKTTAPIAFALANATALGYVAGYQTLIRDLLEHGAAQTGATDTRIEWQFHAGDFCERIKHEGLEPPHAIFYDPYSPAANPEMWTLAHFTQLRQQLRDDAPCLWTNYTRSTAVRVTLLLAGFFVGEGCRIGEKEVTTVAANQAALIERPLDQDWLGRVRRSTNSAPLRSAGTAPGPISEEDWARLTAHPQFMRTGEPRDSK